MTKDQVSNSLLVVALLLVLTAMLTLLPFSASKMNDIGYHSLCPFAPWSTLSLLIAAGVVWIIRGYVLTRA